MVFVKVVYKNNIFILKSLHLKNDVILLMLSNKCILSERSFKDFQTFLIVCANVYLCMCVLKVFVSNESRNNSHFGNKAFKIINYLWLLLFRVILWNKTLKIYKCILANSGVYVKTFRGVFVKKENVDIDLSDKDMIN